MGNRAYITINNEKTFYVHWNGGPDTMLPLFQAIKDFKETLHVEEIEQAFFEVTSQKMELMEEVSYTWCEENGHYFLNLPKKELVRRYESHNNETDLYDILSELYSRPYDQYCTWCKSYLKSEYAETRINQFSEIVEEFKKALLKASSERLKEREKHLDGLSKKSKSTFKKLIRDDIKKERPDLLPKLISVRYQSYSGGDSVRVYVEAPLKEEDREYLKNLCDLYRSGSFNSMEDIYEYSKPIEGQEKARYASFVFLEEIEKEYFDRVLK